MSEIVIVSLVIAVAGLLYFYNRSLTGLRMQKETTEGLRRTLMDTEQDNTYKLALALTLANSAYDALLVRQTADSWRFQGIRRGRIR